mgnify:CR=1 FL=1
MDKATIARLLKLSPAQKLSTGNIRTCPVRLSYPHLFVAKAQTGDDGKPGREVYSAALLFPLGADISLLRTAAAEVAADKFGPAWAKRNLHSPFRDQDERADGDGNLPSGYASGAIFMNVNANRDYPPGVRLRDMQPAKPSDIYPGCWAIVTLRPYAFDTPKKKGVSFGLQNVMKLCDDERLGGGGVAAADKEFAPIDAHRHHVLPLAGMLAGPHLPARKAAVQIGRAHV